MFMLRETNLWLGTGAIALACFALACFAQSGQATSGKVRLNKPF